LSNGKRVRFEVTNYFYWGTFEIELTDKEKEEILKKDSIILNDYSGVSVDSLDSGCDYSDNICNEDSYTNIERREIHRLLYFDENDEESYTNDCDNVDEDVLPQNGWSMDDTIYGMDTGCKLECISGEEDQVAEKKAVTPEPATESESAEMVDCEGGDPKGALWVKSVLQ